jgi:hypothetical protein
MIEARVSRLLPASLHQAISDRLPLRLEFYEHWLHSDALHDGTVGLGALTAVMGFLRTEGAVYHDVVADAGRLAARWTVASLRPMRRRWVHWLPASLRVRAALTIARDVVRSAGADSRVSVALRRKTARVDVERSVFCAVREPHALPLCGFYLAAMIETLEQFGLPATGRVDTCRAARGSACQFTIDLDPAREQALAA